MIADNELTSIGKVIKTHGTAGELNVELYVPDLMVVNKGDCLIFKLDGINVPFYVASSRKRGGDRILLTFEDVVTDTAAAIFTGKEVYALTAGLSEELQGDDEFLTLEDLIGYRLFDSDGTLVGDITGVDDSTENILFEIKRPEGNVMFIPAANDLVTNVDIDNKTISMNLPTGLY